MADTYILFRGNKPVSAHNSLSAFIRNNDGLFLYGEKQPLTHKSKKQIVVVLAQYGACHFTTMPYGEHSDTDKRKLIKVQRF